MEAEQPANPPPTTTRSYDFVCGGAFGSDFTFFRHSANFFGEDGGSASEVEKKMASHRPSKPVKSTNSKAASVFETEILSTYSQPHPERSPSILSINLLSIFNWNLPGASQSPGTQFFVRTQT